MIIHGHNVKKIGSGEFTTAYRSMDDESIVFLLTEYDKHESGNQYVRDIYAHVDSPHVPFMRMMDDVYLKGKWYVCFETRYSYRLTAQHKDAWRIAKILRETWLAQLTATGYGFNWRHDAYQITYNFIDALREDNRIPESIVEALDNIYSWACSYGNNFLLEFPNQNLAVDQDGTLLLRDIVFFRKF